MELCRRIATALARGETVGLASVLENQGSAPAPEGAKVALFADGSRAGTVGGGAPEALVLEALARGETHTLEVAHTLSDDPRALACGGSSTVLLERLTPALAPLFAAAAAALERGEPVALGVVIEDGRAVARGVRLELGVAASGAPELADVLAQALTAGTRVSVPLVDGRVARGEALRPVPRLVVAGAGHVGKAAALVALATGLRTAVVDDRTAVLEALRVLAPEAELHSGEPGAWLRTSPPGPADAVLVATRSVEMDLAAVSAAAASQAYYVGLIGSARKWQSFEARVVAEAGAPAAARVRCPAGLALGGRAPGEIALAVVSEALLAWHERFSGGRRREPAGNVVAQRA